MCLHWTKRDLDFIVLLWFFFKSLFNRYFHINTDKGKTWQGNSLLWIQRFFCSLQIWQNFDGDKCNLSSVMLICNADMHYDIASTLHSATVQIPCASIFSLYISLFVFNMNIFPLCVQVHCMFSLLSFSRNHFYQLYLSCCFKPLNALYICFITLFVLYFYLLMH